MLQLISKIFKRGFDIIFSVFGITLLVPFCILIAFALTINSKGGIFYLQYRIGRGLKPFKLLKFRTMYLNSDVQGLITIGKKDSRITKVGSWLRKYKIDEIPQLINILKGDMSFVGPRPEVPQYVELFKNDYAEIMKFRPGLTDFASVLYSDENEILTRFENPEKVYLQCVLPRKIRLAKIYINHFSFLIDISILLKTLSKIFLFHS